MPGDVLPAPIRVSRAGIWNFAEAAAAKLNFRPDSIEPVVLRLGGRIEYRDARGTGEAPESIVVRSAADFTIVLPAMTSPERDRFTIAHEPGHLFLHYPAVKRQTPNARMVARRWVDEDDVDQQRAEWEVN
ncbi:MAG: ImmA/IrrE family metallo-endopeptidase, partial [Alphaproteobacteria bacterium]|nr:ImmA/IrrE family metallo-endopeptidase [Alphaproteobacteria bacterium]